MGWGTPGTMIWAPEDPGVASKPAASFPHPLPAYCDIYRYLQRQQGGCIFSDLTHLQQRAVTLPVKPAQELLSSRAARLLGH